MPGGVCACVGGACAKGGWREEEREEGWGEGVSDDGISVDACSAMSADAIVAGCGALARHKARRPLVSPLRQTCCLSVPLLYFECVRSTRKARARSQEIERERVHPCCLPQSLRQHSMKHARD